MFMEIVSRNFTNCLSDPSILIYKDCKEDIESGAEAKMLSIMSCTTLEAGDDISKKYNQNLQGTIDSYSDNENEVFEIDHPERV